MQNVCASPYMLRHDYLGVDELLNSEVKKQPDL